ncbi:glycosyltransferase [Capnocytophaga sp. oral taxon 864]|nr:glycosyltransferase [Capnocytophaga sp. oral taxon 864]
MKKRCVGAIRNFRKETKRLERRKGEVLVKKGCKEGGVSL